MEYDINSIKGLELIKQNAGCIFVRIKRDKWKAVSIKEMTALEFIDVLIMWIKQNRKIGDY